LYSFGITVVAFAATGISGVITTARINIVAWITKVVWLITVIAVIKFVAATGVWEYFVAAITSAKEIPDKNEG
jgi:hypothetical protein